MQRLQRSREMVKNSVKVYARLKPEGSRRNVADYKIHSRPKDHLEEDFLVLSTTRRTSEIVDHRPESWNFSFFRILDESATQAEVFEAIARPVVQSALDGYNGTVFAYGQTGSGKTYTITGNPRKYESRGIIPRTLQHLFDVIRKHPENVYAVEVAYLEIYNENGYDLLDRRNRGDVQQATRLEDLPRVAIQEDETGALHLKNLTFHGVENEREAFELLLMGDNNRVTADTPMNPQSSRSHCIFTIVVSTKQFGHDRYRRAKLHFVDLAGSERVYKCAITGTILTEAKHINLSLHYLEQVIVCLGQETAGHVPYRNSLLTSILRDSLGGNCLTTMLATLSVSSVNLEETISTCRFAQRVALIRNDVNLVLETNVQSENALLRLENERLRRQIEAITKPRSQAAELSTEERETLDCQIGRFLDTDTSISWDYDPRKVQYCFEAFKRNILLARSKQDCPRKSEYYKEMVMNRDMEISRLISMLNKERRKREESVDYSPSGYTGEESKESKERKKKETSEPKRSSEKFNTDELKMADGQSTNLEAKNFDLSAPLNEGHAKLDIVKKQKQKVHRKRNKSSENSTNRISSNSTDSGQLPCSIVNLSLTESKSDISNLNNKHRPQSGEKSAVKEVSKEEANLNEEKTKESTIQCKENDQKNSRENRTRNIEQNCTETETFYYEKVFDFNEGKTIEEAEKNMSNVVSGTNTQTNNHRTSETSNKLNGKESTSDRMEVLENQNGKIQKVEIQNSVEDSRYTDAEKNSLPLTGDPEIDEEIIAFYRAKRTGAVY